MNKLMLLITAFISLLMMSTFSIAGDNKKDPQIVHVKAMITGADQFLEVGLYISDATDACVFGDGYKPYVPCSQSEQLSFTHTFKHHTVLHWSMNVPPHTTLGPQCIAYGFHYLNGSDGQHYYVHHVTAWDEYQFTFIETKTSDDQYYVTCDEEVIN